MGDPTSRYAITGIALRVSGALKSHHHGRVEIPSMGLSLPSFLIVIQFITLSQKE
jgi:hypothetical protein